MRPILRFDFTAQGVRQRVCQVHVFGPFRQELRLPINMAANNYATEGCACGHCCSAECSQTQRRVQGIVAVENLILKLYDAAGVEEKCFRSSKCRQGAD